MDLDAAQRGQLWQEAVKRVAGSREAGVKKVRDGALIRLTVNVRIPSGGCQYLHIVLLATHGCRPVQCKCIRPATLPQATAMQRKRGHLRAEDASLHSREGASPQQSMWP